MKIVTHLLFNNSVFVSGTHKELNQKYKSRSFAPFRSITMKTHKLALKLRFT
jgi:hypothetical protein